MKCVITGGPSCGKTSLINHIREKGYRVMNEVAREVLSSGKRMGEEFELEIFEEQLRREGSLEGDVFLDRGIVDVYSYCKMFLGYLPERIAKFDFSGRYDKVFVPSRLPFVPDGVRVESSDEDAKRIHSGLINTYQRFGYEPIIIPIMSIEERGRFVLENV